MDYYSSEKPKYIVHNGHVYKLVDTEKELREVYNDCVKTAELISESIIESMFINTEDKE